MRVQLGDLIMSVKSTKRKQQKRNAKHNSAKHELDRDLHYINQREEIIAEQMGIYDWSGW